jgi:cob(I)alamin adenosyltransferase
VPAVPAGRARRTALTHLVRTFFQGSAERAVAAILESSDTRLTEEELNRLEQLIEQARRKGT